MRRGPHALSVQDDCIVVTTGVSTEARLELKDRQSYVCDMRMTTHVLQ